MQRQAVVHSEEFRTGRNRRLLFSGDAGLGNSAQLIYYRHITGPKGKYD